jgi:hypothetical protein
VKNFLAASLAFATIATAPAAAHPVQLYTHQILNSPVQPGDTAQVQAMVGPYATDALVMVSAQGLSRFDGGNRSSHGISVEILANGLVLQDDSFEGESSKIQYRAAVSHSFVLKRATTRVVTARTRPYGSGQGTNNSTSISMDLAAIAVAP